MGMTTTYTLLFLGNVLLFFLWAKYIVKAVRGRCPHCGK